MSIICLTAAGAAVSGAGAATSRWVTIADAAVRTGGFLAKPAGPDNLIEIQSSTKDGTSEAYLRFDLTDCVSSLDTVKLRVYARLAEAGSGKIVVRSAVDTSWDERSLTWTNKPDQDLNLGNMEVVGISAAWYDLDVSHHVRSELAAGRSRLSFALITGGSPDNKIVIASRESRDHRPELVATRPSFKARVSFLPATSIPPEGFLADNGKLFGPRAGGFKYGWDMENTEMMRDRAHPRTKMEKALKGPERCYEPLAYLEHQKRPKSAKWEIAVPNGTYRVRLMAGDAQSYDSVYAINVEDTLVVDGLPDKDRRWIEGTKELKITDGRLTVSSNPGGSKNKINFIEIAEVGL